VMKLFSLTVIMKLSCVLTNIARGHKQKDMKLLAP
jgi:hypothetical protein